MSVWGEPRCLGESGHAQPRHPNLAAQETRSCRLGPRAGESLNFVLKGANMEEAGRPVLIPLGVEAATPKVGWLPSHVAQSPRGDCAASSVRSDPARRAFLRRDKWGRV